MTIRGVSFDVRNAFAILPAAPVRFMDGRALLPVFD
jgi:hypothetical protein